MSGLGTFAATVVATVFGIAGAAKLWPMPSVRDGLVAFVELALAYFIIGSQLRTIALLVSVGLAGFYSVLSFRKTQKPCHCFGKKLPTTGVRAQRVRNVLLLGVAIIGTAAEASARGGTLSMPVFDYVGGFLTGVLVVSFPWILGDVEHPFGRTY